MAEGGLGGLFKRLQSEVTCPLCLEIFTNPKKLPCDHVYCRACLHGLALRSITGTISCPECRMDIHIPGNGVADFPTPHQVNRLLEMYKESLQSIETDTSKPKPATCEIHSSQPLALYCETCGKLVCSYCALTHCVKKNHQHGFVEDIIKKYESELKSNLEPVKKLHHEMKNALESISAKERELWSTKEGNLQQVQTTFKALVEVLETERRYFTNSVEKSFEEQQVLYSAKKDEISMILMKLEAIIQSVETPSGNKQCTEFLSEVAARQKDIKHSKELAKNFTSSPTQLPEIELNLGNIEDFQEFAYSKNYFVTKSDPLKCHIERSSLDLGNLSLNEPSAATLLLDAGVKQGEISAQLFCCHDTSLQNISVKKITGQKYSLSFIPRRRGKHMLLIKHDDTVLCQIAAFASISPRMLKRRQSSYKQINDIGAIKCHAGKVYVTEVGSAIIILDSPSLDEKESIELAGAGEIFVKYPYIYATDITSHRLLKLKMDGTVVASTGSKGDAPGQFNFPNGIRLSKDNELYVCDSDNHRIQVFDKDLKFIRTFGRMGRGEGCFDNPTCLDMDENGSVYVVEESNSRVQVLTSQGQHIRNIGRSHLVGPVSIIIHREVLYVTDITISQVMTFKTTGEFITSFGEGHLTRPECIGIDDNGFIYISDNRLKLVRF